MIKEKVKVEIINLKTLLPACRRCRIRSDEMLRDDHQPMICDKCRDVIREDFPFMVALEKIPLDKARECLYNHERECECWQEGIQFPPEPAHWRVNNL
jgi:hypothetical protein